MSSALITGANRGLGLEFARQYLADGWHVYATCRHPGSASELQHLAEASDHKLRILALDVTDSASAQSRWSRIPLVASVLQMSALEGIADEALAARNVADVP